MLSDDVLADIWDRLEHGHLRVDPDDLAEWDEHDAAMLREAGWLVRASDAQQLRCDDCDDLHEVEVEDDGRLFMICPVAGISYLTKEQVLVETLDVERIIRDIATGLGLKRAPSCLIEPCLWELGPLVLDQCYWTVHVGLGFSKDGIEAVPVAPDALILTTAESIAPELSARWKATIVRMALPATWGNSGLLIDTTRLGNLVHRTIQSGQTGGRRPDGVYSASEVVWRGVASHISLRGQEERFLRLALCRADVALACLYATPDSVWPRIRSAPSSSRVSTMLNRVNEALANARPPVPVAFHKRPRGEIVREVF